MGAVVAVQLNVTVTGELFQPPEFGWGVIEAVIVGSVVAMLTCAVVLAELPAISVTVPVTA